MREALSFTKELIDFIDSSPSAFHCVQNSAKMLSDAGFTRLEASERFDVSNGGRYFITRGSSALIAFVVPKKISKLSFTIAASHGDSPALKLKPSCETDAFGRYTRLTVEKYGGAILDTWFDRPLSVAGRIAIEENGKIISQNVNIDRDLLIIPSVPPHLSNIEKPTLTVDFLPLYSESSSKSLFALIAEEAGVKEDCILSYDLFVYCRQKGSLLGPENEFFCSPRIDDLQCAYSNVSAICEAKPTGSIPVCVILDNEETGSSSRQGAFSTFLPETLERIVYSLGGNREDFYASLADSFMISADNAHAKHPNHPELFDQQNAPIMNGGIVIKTNASQRYTTDAVSCAIVKKLCEKADVPYQSYANRADLAGGSTLGNIALHQLPVCCADIGLAQLAMHSCNETAGSFDAFYLKRLTKILFESSFSALSDHGYSII